MQISTYYHYQFYSCFAFWGAFPLIEISFWLNKFIDHVLYFYCTLNTLKKTNDTPSEPFLLYDSLHSETTTSLYYQGSRVIEGRPHTNDFMKWYFLPFGSHLRRRRSICFSRPPEGNLADWNTHALWKNMAAIWRDRRSLGARLEIGPWCKSAIHCQWIW